MCSGCVFGHGCASLCVTVGNRPLVSRFPPYLEIRRDVVTSFFFFSVFLQYHQIIKTGWKQNVFKMFAIRRMEVMAIVDIICWQM